MASFHFNESVNPAASSESEISANGDATVLRGKNSDVSVPPPRRLSITSLPSEIIDNIVAECEYDSLSPLSLTARVFRDSAVDELFRFSGCGPAFRTYDSHRGRQFRQGWTGSRRVKYGEFEEWVEWEKWRTWSNCYPQASNPFRWLTEFSATRMDDVSLVEVVTSLATSAPLLVSLLLDSDSRAQLIFGTPPATGPQLTRLSTLRLNNLYLQAHERNNCIFSFIASRMPNVRGIDIAMNASGSFTPQNCGLLELLPRLRELSLRGFFAHQPPSFAKSLRGLEKLEISLWQLSGGDNDVLPGFLGFPHPELRELTYKFTAKSSYIETIRLGVVQGHFPKLQALTSFLEQWDEGDVAAIEAVGFVVQVIDGHISDQFTASRQL